MSSANTPLSTESLLAHAQFVRGLARTLVVDPNLADDVEQQTWLAALQNPPRRSDRVRSWLRSVSANFARRARRDTSRRMTRERHAASAESAPSTAELVARESALRAVVDAVLALPQSHREVILLRFYEDLPPRIIAQRLGLPATTVQSRLQRGLEKLRCGLDEMSDGDRAGWRGALVALVGLPEMQSAAEGVGAGTAGGLWLVAAGLVGLSLLTWGWWPESPPEGPELGRQAVSPTGAAEPNAVVHRAAPAAAGRPPRPDVVLAAGGPATRRPGAVTLHGLCLDERRRPVPGVVVEGHVPGCLDVRTTTSEAGRFVLDVPDAIVSTRVDLGLHARDDQGRAALASWRFEREPRNDGNVGVLTLAPARGFRLCVTDGGRPAAGARVEVQAERYEVRAKDPPYRTDVALASHVCGPAGTATLDGYPAGEYIARIIGDDGRQATVSFTLPDQADDVRHVDLDPGRELVVRVGDAATGEPVAGARVDVRERYRRGAMSRSRPLTTGVLAVTGEDGCVTLPALPPSTALRVRAHAPGFAPLSLGRPWIDVEAARDRVEVRLAATRTITWPVDAAGDHPPAPGTAVRIARTRAVDDAAPASRGRLVGDELIVTGIPRGCRRLLAYAGADLIARLEVPAHGDYGDEAWFEPVRSVEVEVVDEDDVPVSGLLIEGRSQGRGPVVACLERTDARGLATLRGFADGGVAVYFGSTTMMQLYPQLARRVDLSEVSHARVRFVLPRGRDVVARVAIDGEPRLPAQYRLFVIHAIRGPLVEDPARGELRFRAWPTKAGTSFFIGLIGRGHTPGEAEVDATAPGPAEVELDLTPVGRVRVHVSPPPDGWQKIALETWHEAPRAWSAGVLFPRRQVGDRLFFFDELQPGRYRVADVESRVCGEPFEVDGRTGVIERTLDLHHVRWLDVHLDVPKPGDLAEARFRVFGAGLDGRTKVYLAPRGSDRYRTRVPGDRDLTLEPRHPYLVPDEASRVVDVGPDDDEIRVTFVAERQVRFTLPRLRPGHEPIEGRVLLFAGGTEGRLMTTGRLCVRNGVALFVRPDDEDLDTAWIDLPGFPPITRAVPPTPALHDLGAVEPGPGRTLRVSVRSRAGSDPPKVRVRAISQSTPRYVREATSGGEGTVEVAGLAPGDFVVTVTPTEAALGHRRRDYRVQVGDGDVSIDY